MAVTTFIPELWDARLLYALENAHVATAFINRDYEGEIKKQGDTVHINSIGAITVNTYEAGTDITVQDLTTTDQTLVIDQAKYFAFQVDDIDKVQVAGDLIDTATGRAAYALADVEDAFIFGKIAAAGIANDNVIGTAASPIALTAANIYSQIVAMRTAMDKASVPTAGRKLAVSPEVYALLLQDARFTTNNATAEQVTVNGFVGRIAGFDVYETNNLTATDDYTVITASTPEATTYADQIVSTEAFRPESAFADAVKGLHVYGCKVVRPACVVAMYASVS